MSLETFGVLLVVLVGLLYLYIFIDEEDVFGRNARAVAERERQERAAWEARQRFESQEWLRQFDAEQERERRQEQERKAEWARRNAIEKARQRAEQARIAAIADNPTGHFYKWLRGN